MEKLNFYFVNKRYLDYLRNFDEKVPRCDYDKHNRKNKFYCGIILRINNIEYFAPLSHMTTNSQTSFIIRESNGKPISSIKFKFMVPVPKSLYVMMDINQQKSKVYQELLYRELRFCQKNKEEILKKAKYVYTTRINDLLNFGKFCCNFSLLEEKAKLYI